LFKESPTGQRLPILHSQLPERHFLDQMIGALAQDQIGARSCRQDVLAQVLQVDVGSQTLVLGGLAFHGVDHIRRYRRS
jgi:hypothetical protein